MAGIVAGIVGSIVAIVFGYVGVFIGLLQELPPPMIDVVISRFVLHTAWGVIFGALYPKFYDVVPGKATSKGLCYGLLLYLISSVRAATLLQPLRLSHWQQIGSSLDSSNLPAMALFSGVSTRNNTHLDRTELDVEGFGRVFAEMVETRICTVSPRIQRTRRSCPQVRSVVRSE